MMLLILIRLLIIFSNSGFVEILFGLCKKVFNSFDLSFKKNVPYFKLSVTRCLYCGTRPVVKYGFSNRTLIFKEIGKLW